MPNPDPVIQQVIQEAQARSDTADFTYSDVSEDPLGKKIFLNAMSPGGSFANSINSVFPNSPNAGNSINPALDANGNQYLKKSKGGASGGSTDSAGNAVSNYLSGIDAAEGEALDSVIGAVFL